MVIQLIQSVDRIQASHLGLFSAASLRSVVSGLTDKGRWSLHILERPAFSFLPLSATPGFLPLSDKGSPERKGNIPTLEEWRVLWSAWDLVTLHMIPRVMWTFSFFFCSSQVPAGFWICYCRRPSAGVHPNRVTFGIYLRFVRTELPDADPCYLLYL